MKRLIIFIELIIIALLLYVAMPRAEAEPDYFLMNVTFYSLHNDCISDEYNDGFTATMTPIRKGVCAINVDLINGKWVVRSPLELGDKILIEGLGIFSVEDTGRFSERDTIQDIWTVDVFEPNHKLAIEGGRELRKVWVLEG